MQEHAKLYEAKRGYPFDCLPDDRELEKKVCYLNAEHPANNISIDYSCLDNLDPKTIEKHKIEGAVIFTDGSKIKGKVGAAISVWECGSETKTVKLKLEPFCTVFQAELYALDRAVRLIKDKNIRKANILSDSKSSLDIIKRQSTSHPIAHSIKRNLIDIQKEGKEIYFFWIKAHVGVEGNERADQLAKEAALHKRSKADYNACPVSYVKRAIRSGSLGEWQHRYTNGITAGTTKIFLPNVKQAYKIILKTKLNPTLVQILTGHGGFSYYLHRFKCKDNPSCKCDPDVTEDIIHILSECPRFGRQRNDIEVELGVIIKPDNFNELISNIETRNIFLNYCEKIAKIIIKENKTN